MLLLATALTLGSCTKNTTNNYNVTPNPGNDPNGNPTGVQDPEVVTPPPFTIDSADWSYIVGKTGGKPDTFYRIVCEQDNIALDGGSVVDIRIQYSSGDWVSLPDTANYTTFTYVQTKKGFDIEFHDIKGYYPGHPGTQTFEVDIELPAQKGSGYKPTTKTITVRVQHTANGPVPHPEYPIRSAPAPTNLRTR